MRRHGARGAGSASDARAHGLRPRASPSSSAAPPAAEGSRIALPVYYVAETAAGPRLQREFHSVVTSDPASAAVREMLASPTGVDPDYRSLLAARHGPAATRPRGTAG